MSVDIVVGFVLEATLVTWLEDSLAMGNVNMDLESFAGSEL